MSVSKTYINSTVWYKQPWDQSLENIIRTKVRKALNLLLAVCLQAAD